MASERSKQLAELAGEDATIWIHGDGRTAVRDIQYDSRTVKPGDLFVALAGAYFDGHAFIERAVRAGAAAIMAERVVDAGVPVLVTADTRAALAGVAARFFDHPSATLRVTGITGTDGKTTTSYLADHLLRAGGFTVGLMGTVSVRIGDRILDADTRQTTPESLDVQRHLRAMADEGADAAVVEATSHGLALHRLDQVRFTTGVVTNITHEHLEFHGSVEAYRRAKAILFERVGGIRGTAVVNFDDEGARSVLPFAEGAHLTGYGIDCREAHVRATDLRLSGDGARFILHVGDGAIPVATPLVGGFNVANALAAVGAALAHDVSLETIAAALRHAPPIPGRMQPVIKGQPFSVIVDYAHTPESIIKVLSLLRILHPDGRLLLVMGSAGERDREKRPLQGAAAARLADFSVFTSEDPRFEDAEAIITEIAAGARESGAREGADYLRITDRREGIRAALSRARPGDCVLLAGKGHERSIIWGLEKRPWDEAAVAEELLGELGR